MTKTKRSTPTAEEAKIQDAIAGTEFEIPPTSTVIVGGVTLTQPQILAKLHGFLDPSKRAADLRAKLSQALADRAQAFKDAREFLKNYRDVLVAQLGRGNPELAKFGLAPAKAPTPLTAAQNVQRHAKAKASRERLGTKGKKQKAEILRASQTPAITVGADGTISIVPDAPAPKGA